MCLIFAFLLSINSFAAVVSDNDGSAFITKAEFDSLKNDFQSQIDSYNANIDNKIDNAIASYLAGIKVSKDTIYKVEVSDWGEVLATNYVLPEVWRIPSINLTFVFSYASTDPPGTWWESWWGTAGIIYKKPDTEYQVRNLVSAGQESTTYTLPDKVVWVGQSCDYEDSINAVKTGRCHTVYGKGTTPADYEYSYLWGATATGSSMYIIRSLKLSTGYVKNANIASVWDSAMWWRPGTQAATYSYQLAPTVEGEWINKTMKTSVSLNYINNKQYKNEHINTWDNYAWNYLSDPTWTNSIGPNPAFTQDDVINNSSVSKSGRWACLELNDNKRTTASTRQPSGWESSAQERQTTYQPTQNQFSAFYSGGYAGTSSDPMKSVGVLDKTYNSSDIYQWKDKRKLIRDETKSLEKINLYNGTLIAYAKKDERFRWEPKITGSYWNGTSDVQINKWRIKLSKKPFGIKDTLPSESDALKNRDQTTDYLVTNDFGTCKYDITMSDDTVVWCKWWPDDDNIRDNYAWQGILDLNSCGTYTISTE